MYLHEERELFRDAVNMAAYRTGLENRTIEKDYFVTMVLRELSVRSDQIVFKGGTSLLKCHRVIARFSEDIDIAVERRLTQGQKKKLKYSIVEAATTLRLTIPNLDDTRSRRDYNRYILLYDSVSGCHRAENDIFSPAVLLETSYAEIAFPVAVLPVHSYIGDMFEEEAPEAMDLYDLRPFGMKVQGLDRTLTDKVFAICDYYLKESVRKHSRHIYDIYKLLPLVPLNDAFRSLVKEVRAVRAQTNICPSAQPGINVTELLKKILDGEVYKKDYDFLTVKLLQEKVSYEESAAALREIAESGMFDT